MRGFSVMTVALIGAAAVLVCGCSASHAVATGPVSIPDAGKAAFNETKAIEKIYNAGYTHIAMMTRDPDGVWSGHAVRRSSREPVVVSVTEGGPVIVR